MKNRFSVFIAFLSAVILTTGCSAVDESIDTQQITTAVTSTAQTTAAVTTTTAKTTAVTTTAQTTTVATTKAAPTTVSTTPAVTTTVATTTGQRTQSDISEPENDPFVPPVDPFDGFGTLGTSGMLDGTTAIVSIFVSDRTTEWNFSSAEDKEMLEHIDHSLDVATKWITRESHKYDRDAQFIYDWGHYPQLRYEADLSADFLCYDDYWDWYTCSWEYIYENIDSISLKEELGVDNIAYMIFLNSDIDSELGSYSRGWYEGILYPYEISFIHVQGQGFLTSAGTYAHELLHLFGAPDLYMASSGQTTDEFAAYLDSIDSNDIMYTCYDPIYGYLYYDVVVNEITDVTAYYLGWVDESALVAEWGLGESQHFAYDVEY